MLPDDDPGWPLSPRIVLGIIPLYGTLYRRRLRQGPDPGIDALVLLRQLFISFCTALVLFGVVLAILYPGTKPPADPPTLLVAGLLMFGALSALVMEPRIERPLVCANDETLRVTYRQRFFLRVAFSEAAALFGYVGFFLTYEWWPYPVGVAIAALGFRRAAPTRTNLRRDQERLAEQGCFRPLVPALRGRSA